MANFHEQQELRSQIDHLESYLEFKKMIYRGKHIPRKVKCRIRQLELKVKILKRKITGGHNDL